MDSKATGAALVNGPLRKQIRLMSERDGATAEEISLMLGVPQELVEEILLPRTAPADTEKPDDEYSESLGAAREIESELRQHRDRAIEVFGECMESDVDGIRLAAADRILKYSAGGLRPERREKTPIQQNVIAQFNMIVQQAMSAYQNTLKPQPPEVATMTDALPADNV